MLDNVPRDTPRQASNAGLGCAVRLYQTGDLMGGCLQLIISKHQPDLAHAGQSKLALLCCFVSHTREHVGLQQRMKKNHVSATLTRIPPELYS